MKTTIAKAILAFIFIMLSTVGGVRAAPVNVSFDGTLTLQIVGVRQYVEMFSSIDWYTVDLSVPTTLNIGVTRTSGNLSPALALYSYDPTQYTGSLLSSAGTFGTSSTSLSANLGSGYYAVAVLSTGARYSGFGTTIYPDYSFNQNSNYQVSFVGDAITVSPSLVPVPPSFWLLWSGIAFLMGIARRGKVAK